MKITVSYSLHGKETKMNEEFSFEIPNQDISKTFLPTWNSLISSLRTMQNSSLDGLNASESDLNRHFPTVRNWQNMYFAPTEEEDYHWRNASEEEDSEEKNQ